MTDWNPRHFSKPVFEVNHGAATPGIFGCYIVKADPLDGQEPSWTRVELQSLPLSSAELENISNDAENASSEGFEKVFRELSTTQQGIVRRVIDGQRAKSTNGTESWVINYIRTYKDDKSSSEAAEIEKILLILKRDGITSPMSVGAGKIVDLKDPPPRRNKADKVKTLMKFVHRDPDDPVDPLKQLISANKSSKQPAISGIPVQDYYTSQGKAWSLPGSTSGAYNESDFAGYRHSTVESDSEPEEVVAEAQARRGGVELVITPRSPSESPDRPAGKAEPTSGVDKRVNFSQTALDQNSRDRSRRKESRGRSRPIETNIPRRYNRSPSRETTYPNPYLHLPPRGSPQFGSSYGPKGLPNPFAPPSVPSQFNEYGPSGPMYYPQANARPSPYFSDSGYSSHAPTYPSPPYQWARDPRNSYSEQSLFGELSKAKSEIEALKKAQQRANEDAKRDRVNQWTQDPRNTSPSSLIDELSKANREIETMKIIQQHIQEKAKRDETEWRMKAEAMEQRLKEAQAHFGAEFATLQALMMRHIEGRNERDEAWRREISSRDATWRKELEYEASSKAAVAAKVEEERRQREEAERKTAEFIRAIEEERKRELSSRNLENERLRERLQEKLESDLQREKAELAKKQVETEVALISNHTDWKDREIERLRAELQAANKTTNTESFKSAVDLGVRESMVELIRVAVYGRNTGVRYLDADSEGEDEGEDGEAEEEDDDDDEDSEEELELEESLQERSGSFNGEEATAEQLDKGKRTEGQDDDKKEEECDPEESRNTDLSSENGPAVREDADGMSYKIAQPCNQADKERDESDLNKSTVMSRSAEHSKSEQARASDQTDSGPVFELQKLLIDKFAHRCCECVGFESISACFVEDSAKNGVVQQIENLIQDFAVLTERRSGNRSGPAWSELIAIIVLQRSKIVAQIRDTAHASKLSVDQRTADWLSNDDRGPEGSTDFIHLEQGHAADSPSDLEKTLDILLHSSDFRWLVGCIKKQSLFSETGVAVSTNRSQLARTIAALPPTSSLRMAFDWDPISFISQQYSGGHVKLTDVVVYCGVSHEAFATTAGDYVNTFWPETGKSTLECIQNACSSLTRVAEHTKDKIGLEVSLEYGRTLICVTEKEKGDSSTDMLEIAEICTWLATACRANDSNECLAHCSADLIETASKNEISNVVEVKLQLRDVETSGPQHDGLCWSKMVRNPVIAQGYPIPKRDHSGVQRGLEISLDLMVTLSHAYWATTYGTLFLLKGLTSALVPVLEVGASLIWHLSINEDGSRMTYQQACEPASSSSPKVCGPTDLHERRHFVGVWSASARFMAGSSDQTLYSDVGLSASKLIDRHTVSLSNLSLQAGQYLQVSAAFAIAKKDTAPSLHSTSNRPYRKQIREAANTMSVVFYATEDRRGWLLDGASALMHLARLWLSLEENTHIDPDELAKIIYRDPQGGHDSAVKALEKNENSDIRIFEDSRTDAEGGGEGSSSANPLSDSGYYSLTIDQKSKQELTTSMWSFKELILNLYQLLETMYDKANDSKFHSLELPVRVPNMKPVLAGWETKHILTKRGPFYPREVELDPGAAPWLRHVKNTSAIVLLAQTFGDLILPEKEIDDGCSRLSRMSPGYDNLAVPLYVLLPEAKRYMRGAYDCSGGCVQIADDTFWHGFEAVVHRCQGSSNDCACRTVSTMSRNARYGNKKQMKGRSGKVNVFTNYPNGVAIIGGINNTSKKEPSSKWAQWRRLTSRRISSNLLSPSSTSQPTDDSWSQLPASPGY